MRDEPPLLWSDVSQGHSAGGEAAAPDAGSRAFSLAVHPDHDHANLEAMKQAVEERGETGMRTFAALIPNCAVGDSHGGIPCRLKV